MAAKRREERDREEMAKKALEAEVQVRARATKAFQRRWESDQQLQRDIAKGHTWFSSLFKVEAAKETAEGLTIQQVSLREDYDARMIAARTRPNPIS